MIKLWTLYFLYDNIDNMEGVIRNMRVKFICESCGDIEFDGENYQCPICNVSLTKLGFIDGHKLMCMNGKERIQWLENKLGHPISEEMINRRWEYYKKQDEEEQRRLEEEREAYERRARQSTRSLSGRINVPKCPVCGSTSLKKISLTTRAVKTAAFGTIGAIDDAGKTYKCENCGSKF